MPAVPTAAAHQKRPEYLGEPTLGQIMRRPIWILALLFAMLVAGAFAWLGQWQMGNAIRTDDAQIVDTETVRSFAEAAELGTGVTEDGAGVVVNEVIGEFTLDDLRTVAPRENQGESGAWVVAHLTVEDPRGHLAVALGWAPSEAEAAAAAQRIATDSRFAERVSLEGRYMPPEGPKVPRPSEDPQSMQTMMPAFLANSWNGVDAPVYSGFLVMHTDDDGAALLDAAELEAIDSVPPIPPERVNWLNVFYAIEWVVFAGFALFFWFRLTRDAWEKEHEMQLLEAAAAAENVTAEHDPRSATQHS